MQSIVDADLEQVAGGFSPRDDERFKRAAGYGAAFGAGAGFVLGALGHTYYPGVYGTAMATGIGAALVGNVAGFTNMVGGAIKDEIVRRRNKTQ